MLYSLPYCIGRSLPCCRLSYGWLPSLSFKINKRRTLFLWHSQVHSRSFLKSWLGFMEACKLHGNSPLFHLWFAERIRRRRCIWPIFYQCFILETSSPLPIFEKPELKAIIIPHKKSQSLQHLAKTYFRPTYNLKNKENSRMGQKSSFVLSNVMLVWLLEALSFSLLLCANW